MTQGLAPEELRFLALVAPLGLDGRTPRSVYEARYGRSSYYGVWDVITIAPMAAITRTPLAFHMHVKSEDLALPPEYLWANHRPFDDARANHRDLVAQLETTFGPSTPSDTSNSVGNVFRFGVFSVRAHALPRELQPEWLTRRGANPLLDAHPELRDATTVELRSEYAWVLPDACLRPVARLLDGGAPRDVTLSFHTHLDGGRLAASPDRRLTRRTPAELAARIPRNRILAFRDDVNGRFGLAGARDALHFDRHTAARLVLLRLEPARGPGGHELLLEVRHPAGPSSVMLLDRGVIPEDAEGLAERLAELFRLPLGHGRAWDD